MEISKELIKACNKQKRKAQYELYQLCYAPMMSVCLRYQRNKDDAHALLNQSFLKVLDHLNKFDFEGPFEAWVKRITINTAIDEYRKQKKHQEKIAYVDFDPSRQESPDISFNEGEAALDAEALRGILKQLPETSERVFNLIVLDGYSYEEVAEKLSMTQTTCRWHVHQARKLLKEIIEKSYSKPLAS